VISPARRLERLRQFDTCTLSNAIERLSLLYEVSPLDPPVFIAVSLGLATVALVAILVPADRATGIDPLEALRSE